MYSFHFNKCLLFIIKYYLVIPFTIQTFRYNNCLPEKADNTDIRLHASVGRQAS